MNRQDVLRAAGWGGVALLAQAFALGQLGDPSGSAAGPLLRFWGLQAVAALSSAACFFYCMPLRMRHPAWKPLLFNTSFVLFMPIGGQLVLGGTLLLHALMPRGGRRLDVTTVDMPSFEPKLLDRVRPGAASRARNQVSHAVVQVQERMAAMMAIRTLPLHVTGDLLRSLLGDTQDEVRLLAYGIMDREEKRIMQRITEARQRLAHRRGTRWAAVDHAHLAELYWELVYHGLVQGDMRRYTQDQAVNHARSALELRPGLAGMYFLLGRAALADRHPEQAREHFQAARQHGMRDARLAPWMSEALFQEGRFSEIGPWMRTVGEMGGSSQLASVSRYWA